MKINLKKLVPLGYPVHKKNMPIKERFERYVFYSPDGCNYWIGGCDSKGYGRISINSRRISAHRVSYEIYKGKIEVGACVCHACDNPLCVNPDHLFLGTQKDNINDCVRKGRNAHGVNTRQAILNESQVCEIKELFRNGGNPSKIALAKKYNVSDAAIYLIAKGRNWKHI